jgi:hypothetical protein
MVDNNILGELYNLRISLSDLAFEFCNCFNFEGFNEKNAVSEAEKSPEKIIKIISTMISINISIVNGLFTIVNLLIIKIKSDKVYNIGIIYKSKFKNDSL